MKTYCKGIDITDRKLISKSVYQCLEGTDKRNRKSKYNRNDTLNLMAAYSGIDPEVIRGVLKEGGKRALKGIVETVIDGIRQEIIDRKLIMKPIWYSRKVDASSGKVRDIGIQDIKQQMYDYIAVNAMKPIFHRIGEFQCAAIKGRGQSYGIRAIRRWLRNKAMRYAGKADIRKCYESIPQDALIAFLRKYVRNEPLLWLVEQLIRTFRQGLSIGSYLSQFLCNLYLSQLYHYISEELYVERKHRDGTLERINLVGHTLFYMDDLLILGSSQKHLKKAMRLIIKKAGEMGLDIKPDWTVYTVRLEDRKRHDGTYIDMMGVRPYRYHATIRRRVYKRVRRVLLRVRRRILTHRTVPSCLARRVISYNGIIKSTDSFMVRKKYHFAEILRFCRKEISHEGKVRAAAAAG